MLLVWNFGESRDKKKSRSVDVVSWAVHSGNCVFIFLLGVFVHLPSLHQPQHMVFKLCKYVCVCVCVCVLMEEKKMQSKDN